MPRLARPGAGRVGTVGSAAAVGTAAAPSTGLGAAGAFDVEPDKGRVGVLQQRDMDSGLTPRGFPIAASH